MKLQRQPNGWSCLPASFAMALDHPFAKIIELVGHDGSEIAFPNQPDPRNRKCFHIQELIFVADKLGFTVTPFEGLFTGSNGEETIVYDRGAEVEEIMEDSYGVVTGNLPDGRRHAMAWDGKEFLDPGGFPKAFTKDFGMEVFWRVMTKGIVPFEYRRCTHINWNAAGAKCNDCGLTDFEIQSNLPLGIKSNY